MQKMSFSKAKEASPENIEDQIHKPVPQHLERVVSKKTVISTGEAEEANKEAEEEARKAAEQQPFGSSCSEANFWRTELPLA